MLSKWAFLESFVSVSAQLQPPCPSPIQRWGHTSSHLSIQVKEIFSNVFQGWGKTSKITLTMWISLPLPRVILFCVTFKPEVTREYAHFWWRRAATWTSKMGSTTPQFTWQGAWICSKVVFLDNIENINSQAGHAQCVAYLTRGRHSPRLEEVERASLPDF